MAAFGTVFHATLEEIIGLVESWMDRYPIHASAFAFPPARQVVVTRETIREVLQRPDVRSLIFTDTLPDPAWSQAHDAVVSDVDALRFNIGREHATGLEQSFMSTSNATPLWSKLNRELKKLATAGANCIWNDGDTTLDRNARFTAGAKALAASGVPLRQFENSMRFHYMPK